MPRRKNMDGPHPVDIYVGNRIRLRRRILGYSQVKTATALDTSFQQLQKYESGANRVSASRLYDIAEVLGVPVTYFFKDAPKSNAHIPSDHERAVEFAKSAAVGRMLNAFRGIASSDDQDHAIELVKSIAAHSKARKAG